MTANLKNESLQHGANNVLIGENAGLYLTDENNKVIIGDNIFNLDKSQKDVLFIGESVAIGKTIGGKPCNLFDLIVEYAKESNIPFKTGTARSTQTGDPVGVIGWFAGTQIQEPRFHGDSCGVDKTCINIALGFDAKIDESKGENRRFIFDAKNTDIGV